MSNTSIFVQAHAPRTSRRVPGFDNIYSNLAVGHIVGQCRMIDALLSPTATDADLWQVVNLKSKGATGALFDAVAVIGALDADQAVEWVQSQYGRFFDSCEVQAVTESNGKGLMRYLNSEKLNPRDNLPVYSKNLLALQDVTTMQPAMWDGINLKSHGGSTATLLLDLVKHDDDSQLFDAMKADDMPAMLEWLGAEMMGYDAIIVENRRLDKLMQLLSEAMDAAAGGGLTISNYRQSEPFKRNKVTQVAAIFEVSDGQSVSIVFHNPDSTPSKLLPGDTLISWKILLNARDVSAAVQPNQGEDVQLPVLAIRIMKLVNQNSARFTRTNAKKAENAQELTEVSGRIEQHSATIAGLDAEMVVLQAELDKPVVQSKKPPMGYSGVWDSEDGGKYPFLSVRPEGIASFATREEAEQHYAANSRPAPAATESDDVTQAEADDWNAGDEKPYNGQYKEYDGQTINYVITKPQRNAKGVLIVSDRRKGGGRTRINQLCEAKGINGRWSRVQGGYVISSEKKVEKLIDLLNAGWSTNPMTGDLIAPNKTIAPQPDAKTTSWIDRIPAGMDVEKFKKAMGVAIASASSLDHSNDDQSFRYTVLMIERIKAMEETDSGLVEHMPYFSDADNKISRKVFDAYTGTTKIAGKSKREIVSGILEWRGCTEAEFLEMQGVVDTEKARGNTQKAVAPFLEIQQDGYNGETSSGTLQRNGKIMAATATEFREFTTKSGAAKWLFDRGFSASGVLIGDDSDVVAPSKGDVLKDARQTKYLSAKSSDEDGAPTNKQLIDQRLADGWVLEELTRPDTAKNNATTREYESLQRSAPIGNKQHPDTIRLIELRALIKTSPHNTPLGFSFYKLVDSLVSPTNRLMYLPKAGVDYVKGLSQPVPAAVEPDVPATSPDADYLNSVISGATPLATLADIKAVQAELKRMDAELEANPNAELDDLVGQAFDLVKAAAKKAMQAAA